MSVKDIIHPPAYQPTEQEHRIAYLTWILQDLVYDTLLGINMARTGGFDNKKLPSDLESAKTVEKGLKFLDDYLFAKWRDDGNKEAWECYRDYDQFKKENSDALADYHCGDCTCVSAPCCRCHAEDLYKIPSTRTWGSNHDGAKLLGEYLKEEKKNG